MGQDMIISLQLMNIAMTFVQLESTCPASLVLGVANTEKPPPLLEIEISLSRNRLKFGGYFLFDDH